MKKRTTVILIIILVAALMIAVARSGIIPAFAGRRAVNVRVVSIKNGEISSKVTASGVVEEAESIDIFVDGTLKIKKMEVKEHEKVVKGQKLFELDLESMQLELEQLESNRNIQKMNIEKLEATDTTRDITSLELALSAAENNVRNAQLAYNESVSALMDAVAAGQNTERLERNVESAKIALENAKINYQTSINNLNEAKESNARAIANKEIDLNIQRENLRILDLRIKNLKQKIQELNESQYSPKEGIISNIYVDEGLYTNSARSVLKIMDSSIMQVRVKINEYSIKDVRVGQKVEITGDAIPKDSVITGTIDSITPYAVSSASSGGQEVVVEAIITVDNQEGILRPGYSVTCDISTNTKKDVLIAPMEIISEESDGTLFAFVVDEKENVMRKRYIETGIFSDMYIEIMSGLEEGDLCIMDPQPFYTEGMRVNVTGKKNLINAI